MSSSNGYHRNEYDRNLDMEGMIDDARPPQLDKVICRCRFGCACSSSRENSNGDSKGGDSDGVVLDKGHHISSDGYNIISDETESVQGQEGVEYNLTAVDRHMAHRMARVLDWRAQVHQPNNEGHPRASFSFMETSGILPPESLVVEPPDDEIIQSRYSTTSHTDSTHSMNLGDPFSEIGAHIAADEAFPQPANHFHGEPLWLTHERAFLRNMEIGRLFAVHIYPTEISIGNSASSGP